MKSKKIQRIIAGILVFIMLIPFASVFAEKLAEEENIPEDVGQSEEIGQELIGEEPEQPEMKWEEEEALEHPKDRQLIVKLNENRDIFEIIAGQGLEEDVIIKKKYPGRNMAVVEIKENVSQNILELLQDADGVVFAQKDYRLFTTTISTQEDVWNVQNIHQVTSVGAEQVDTIHLTDAHQITTGSEDIVVAVLDTGIDLSHEALKDNIYTNPLETEDGTDTDQNGYTDDVHGWDFYNDDATVYDGARQDSHGTHIAGIIAGNAEGLQSVAPNVKLLPLKCFEGNYGYTSDVIEAILYAENKGIKTVNCSFAGIDNNAALAEVMASSEMLFVCAAGNYGKSTNEVFSFPACYGFDNIIAVSAVDNENQIAPFSNYGGAMNVYAPGVEVWSALPENTYGLRNGTSCSAAYVTGCCALAQSLYPDITIEELSRMVIPSSQESPQGSIQLLGEETLVPVLNVQSALQYDIQKDREDEKEEEIILDPPSDDSAGDMEVMSDPAKTQLMEGNINKVKYKLEGKEYEYSDVFSTGDYNEDGYEITGTIEKRAEETMEEDVYRVYFDNNMELKVHLQMKPGCDYDLYLYGKEYITKPKFIPGSDSEPSYYAIRSSPNEGTLEEVINRVSVLGGVEYFIVVRYKAGNFGEDNPYILSFKTLSTEQLLGELPPLALDKISGTWKTEVLDQIVPYPNLAQNIKRAVSTYKFRVKEDCHINIILNRPKKVDRATLKLKIYDVTLGRMTEPFYNEGLDAQNNNAEDKQEGRLSATLHFIPGIYHIEVETSQMSVFQYFSLKALRVDESWKCNIETVDENDKGIAFPETIDAGEVKGIAVKVKNKGYQAWNAPTQFGVIAPGLIDKEDGHFSFFNKNISYNKSETFNFNLTAPDVKKEENFEVHCGIWPTYDNNLTEVDFIEESLNPTVKVIPAYEQIEVGRKYNVTEPTSKKRYKINIPEAGLYAVQTFQSDIEGCSANISMLKSNLSTISPGFVQNQLGQNNNYGKREYQLEPGDYYVDVNSKNGENLNCLIFVQKINIDISGLNNSVRLKDRYVGYYKFTPSASGDYIFSTEKGEDGACYTMLTVSTKGGSKWTGTYDGNIYAKAKVYLQAGTTYYIQVTNAEYYESGKDKMINCSFKIVKDEKEKEEVKDNNGTGQVQADSSSITIESPKAGEAIMQEPGHTMEIKVSFKNIDPSSIAVDIAGAQGEFVKQSLPGAENEITKVFRFKQGNENKLYEIIVSGTGTNNKRLITSRKIALFFSDDGDTPQSATKLEYRSDVFASVYNTNVKQDVDFFVFSIPSDGEYFINVAKDIGSSTAMEVELYEGSNLKNRIGTSSGQASDKNIKTVAKLKAGKNYFVKIFAQDPQYRGVAAYTVSLRSASEDEVAESAEKLRVSTGRVKIESIGFHGSSHLYQLHFDQDIEYAIESIGGKDADCKVTGILYESSNGKPGREIRRNTDFGGGKDFVLKHQGTGDYFLKIEREDYSNIGLSIAKPGMSDLIHEKQTGGNFMYVNNPEYLAHVDTLSANTARYVYNQERVTGRNILYETHFEPEIKAPMDVEKYFDYERHDVVYYDMDFYNPGNEEITVTINSLGYETYATHNEWIGVEAFSNYLQLPVTMEAYMHVSEEDPESHKHMGYVGNPKTPGEILGNKDRVGSFQITIPKGEHRLLFYNNGVAWNESFYMPTKYEGSMPIFFLIDFTVENNAEVNIGMVADYSRDNMMDKLNNNKVSPSKYIYERRGEGDIQQKYKGIDFGHLPVVNAELDYVLTDQQKEGSALTQYIIDDTFYTSAKPLGNPVKEWQTRINPYYDVWALRGGVTPAALMEYEYQDEEGKWKFAYDRSDGLGMAEGYYQKTDDYQNASIKGYPHPNGTQKAEEELMNHINGDAIALSWIGKEITITDNLTTKFNARNGYAYALGMGEWGVLYRYKVRLKNTTQNKMTLSLQLKTTTDIILAYKEENSPFKVQTNINRWMTEDNQEQYQTMFTMEIGPGEAKEYEYMMANMIGPSPCSQKIQIDKVGR